MRLNHYSRAGEWGLVLAARAGGANGGSSCPESLFSGQILLSLVITNWLPASPAKTFNVLPAKSDMVIVEMATISGEPGKMSLKFSSEEGIEKFEQKFYLEGAQAAAFLRDLAAEIEAGNKIEAAYGSWAISMQPQLPIKVEVEYEKDELEIEIKIKEMA
jgi:amphi-Trp domain-containing protein